MIDLLGDEPASDVLAIGLQERMVDLFELGDGPAFAACLGRFGEVVDALQQPFFLWIRALFEGLCALLEGDVDGAERRAFETLDLGRRVGTSNAFSAHLAQIFAIRYEQGRLSELAAPVGALLEERPDVPLFLAALAGARAAGGDLEDTREVVDRLLATPLADVPRDLHWLATLGMAANAAAMVGDFESADTLARSLEPYRGRMIQIGYAAATFGAVDHHLGVLAGARGLPDEAREHFRAAEALHERAGARLWAARSRSAREAVA